MRHTSPNCLNCGEATPGAYCGACGQRNVDLRASVWELTVDMFAEAFELDSRIGRTIVPFLFKPGFLTNEHNAGRRTRYSSPLRLYLFASALFFFIASFSGSNIVITGSSSTIETTGGERPGAIDAGSRPADGGERAMSESLASALAQARTRDRADAGEGEGDSGDESDQSDAGAAFDSGAATLDAGASVEADAGSPFVLDAGARAANDAGAPAAVAPRDAGAPGSPWVSTALREDLEAMERGPDDAGVLHVRLHSDPSELARLKKSGKRHKLAPRWMRWLHIPQAVEKAGAGLERLLAGTPEDRERTTKALGDAVISNIPKLMFVLVPLLALLFKLFYWRTKYWYTEHLTLVFHLHAFAFLLFSVQALLPLALTHGGRVAIAVALLALLYSLLAIRRVYAQSWPWTLFKFAGLTTIYLLLIGVGAAAVVFVGFLQI